MYPSEKAIGRIEIVPVRQVFPHEAHAFTRWLADNIESLAERLGIGLTVLEREKSVGDFNVDLLCEDINGRRVIIENQLERTDHDHLGKVLTYLVNLEAETAIWIATESRLEHQRVVDWLNENTADNIAFYMVKVEAIRIGDSPYAPLFTVLAKPDEQIKQAGAAKQELAEREVAERHRKRLAFWTRLLEKSNLRTRLSANRSPSDDHWLSVSTGRSGINFNYLIMKDRAAVDVNIDVGDQATNKAIFDALQNQREQIVAALGFELDWRRLEDKRASRIVHEIYKGNLRDEDSWDALQDEMIDHMIRLDQVFRPQLQKFRNL